MVDESSEGAVAVMREAEGFVIIILYSSHFLGGYSTNVIVLGDLGAGAGTRMVTLGKWSEMNRDEERL